jgi:hypothetical protein
MHSFKGIGHVPRRSYPTPLKKTLKNANSPIWRLIIAFCSVFCIIFFLLSYRVIPFLVLFKLSISPWHKMGKEGGTEGFFFNWLLHFLHTLITLFTLANLANSSHFLINVKSVYILVWEQDPPPPHTQNIKRIRFFSPSVISWYFLLTSVSDPVPGPDLVIYSITSF